MSFIFTMRSAPASAHSRNPSSGSPLPAISEDGTSNIETRHAPPIPLRASNRPANKHFALGAPPRHSYDSPPAYSHFSFDDEGERPNAEKLAAARDGVLNNKHIARRGGWKRLLVIAIIVALCTVGLVVGLVFGLRNRHKSSSNGSTNTAGGASGNIPAGPSNPATSTAFPAGSYSFTTYLSTVSTNCTSDPATWTCYPYTTYSQSPSASTATFQWIIDPVPDSKSYTISSTDNLFSIVFTNLTLSLMNAGQTDEHYYFSTTMQKPTKPSVPLTDQNLASTCYFNQTIFEGYLYTKMKKTFPSGSSNETNTGQPFGEWPFAVSVDQMSGGGTGTPTCLGPDGQSLGSFSVADASQLCECLYLNNGT
ncbi:hypothetical protein N431DRAFT_485891 [Stipitochalara longipes BDJ]|nr:hypothetical protein N431DRAFT_485891 [Stipitochalara longipes BDJ]